MPQWNVAAAQYGARNGELEANIQHHLRFITCAVNERVDLLVFPEYSLTGLSDCHQQQRAMTFDSPLLDPIQQAAEQHHITVIAGVPLRRGDTIIPGAIGFMPDGSRIAYYKPGNDVSSWDAPFPGAPVLGQQGRSFALGINSEGQEENWPRCAAGQGADLYATGRVVCEVSWQNEVMHLQRWSHKYKLPVLMANHAWTGNSTGIRSAGRSACWDDQGQLIVRADEGELLVIGRRNAQGWQGEIIPLV